MMFKKIAIFALCLITLGSQSVIINIDILTKKLPNGETQTIYLLGDYHNPGFLNTLHAHYIFNLATSFEHDEVVVLVEDGVHFLEANLPLNEINAYANYGRSFMNGLVQQCTHLNIPVKNLEFRPITVAGKKRSYTALMNHWKNTILKELKALATWSSKNTVLNKWYQKLYTTLKMKHVPFIESCFTNYAIDYTAYLDTRLFLAANLLDAHFIYNIDHTYTTTKNIIVCAGNCHTQHIRNVLQKADYITTFSTDTNDTMAKYRKFFKNYALKPLIDPDEETTKEYKKEIEPLIKNLADTLAPHTSEHQKLITKKLANLKV